MKKKKRKNLKRTQFIPIVYGVFLYFFSHCSTNTNNNNNNLINNNNNNNNNNIITADALCDAIKPISDDVSNAIQQQHQLVLIILSDICSDVFASLTFLISFSLADSQVHQQSEQQQICASRELSRKTSTASECTTMSDYTPENTISSSTTSSPPTISMFQNIRYSFQKTNQQENIR